jgi:hypothetical protein
MVLYVLILLLFQLTPKTNRVLTFVRVLIFLRYYEHDFHLPVEPLYPRTMLAIESAFAMFIFPISLAALWHNDEGWVTKPALGRGFVIYTVYLGIFRTLLNIYISFRFWD